MTVKWVLTKRICARGARNSIKRRLNTTSFLILSYLHDASESILHEVGYFEVSAKNATIGSPLFADVFLERDRINFGN